MTRLKSFAAVLAAVTALAACAPVSILNGITPASTFDRTKNVSFGDGERDTLDIYRAEDPKADAPVLLFVHGAAYLHHVNPRDHQTFAYMGGVRGAG